MNSTSLKRPNSSPLRYPGGKSALYPLLSGVLKLNSAVGGTYVEPYAGGAGIALGLLFAEQVENIVINDLDPSIYAFWKSITEHSDDFAERIESVQLHLDEWRVQRDIYRAGNVSRLFELGFATFYLNRTNRSGVLNGGVIGGQAQSGKHKIDARFNRKSLIERCRLIGLYSSRIDVRFQDGVDIINEYVSRPRTLVYADPPYFEKAGRLYLNAFNNSDHSRLASCLNDHSSEIWMLTYDNVPQVIDLYRSRRQSLVEVRYSVHKSRDAKELLITSDATELPHFY